MAENAWGSKEWQEDHFPSDQLDSDGDTWGIRWRGMEKMRHRSYTKLIEDKLRASDELRVLDIGCALCDFTEKAWQLNQNNQFWGMDVSENAIAWVKKKFPMFSFQAGAIPEIPFDIEFDVVLCLEVICYVNADDRKSTIDNIHRVLTPSGILMFSGCLDGGHKHHTEEEIIGLIEREFEIEKIVYNHWKYYRRLIENPLEAYRSMLTMLLESMELPNEEFQSWLSENDGGVKATIVKALRLSSPISTWLLRAFLWPVQPILGSRHLAEIFHGISKLTRRRGRADEIVVLAVKK